MVRTRHQNKRFIIVNPRPFSGFNGVFYGRARCIIEVDATLDKPIFREGCPEVVDILSVINTRN